MSGIFLAAGIMMISAATGAVFLSVLKRRRAELIAVSGFLGELAIMIRFSAPRLAPLIDELCKKECYSRSDFLCRLKENTAAATDIGEAWRRAAREAAFLPEECRAALISAGDSIGATDIDGQLAVIGARRAEVDRCFAAADEEYRRKGRLIASVCPLIGIGISVMML